VAGGKKGTHRLLDQLLVEPHGHRLLPQHLPGPETAVRRFRRLSALRAHTKTPYKISLLWKTIRALNRPGRARTETRWPSSSARKSASPPEGGGGSTEARKVLGWPKRCRLVHAFLWECSYERLKLPQFLGQQGVFLT
jgi:hypothetical protein